MNFNLNTLKRKYCVRNTSILIEILFLDLATAATGQVRTHYTHRHLNFLFKSSSLY